LKPLFCFFFALCILALVLPLLPPTQLLPLHTRHDEKNADSKYLVHTHAIAVVYIRCLLSKPWFPNHVDDVAYAFDTTESGKWPGKTDRSCDSK